MRRALPFRTELEISSLFIIEIGDYLSISRECCVICFLCELQHGTHDTLRLYKKEMSGNYQKNQDVITFQDWWCIPHPYVSQYSIARHSPLPWPSCGRETCHWGRGGGGSGCHTQTIAGGDGADKLCWSVFKKYRFEIVSKKIFKQKIKYRQCSRRQYKNVLFTL